MVFDVLRQKISRLFSLSSAWMLICGLFAVPAFSQTLRLDITEGQIAPIPVATGIGAICPSVMSSRNVCEKAGTANNPQMSIHADDKLNSLLIFCLSTSNTIPASS